MPELKNMLVVSHVVHYQHADKISAYGPYAREIDIWADLFPKVMIAAPCRETHPPSDCSPFRSQNIELIPQLERGGDTLNDKLNQMISLPLMVAGLSAAMRRADSIQVRCPGNLGLLGTVLAPFFSRYRVAKYAGQWNGYSGEAWSYRLQRRILSSRWWNAPVTVYGEWKDQPAKVIPFFTSILEEGHLARARKCAENKIMHRPLRVLFVGRLSREKNVHILLGALQLLQGMHVEFECHIIGEGSMRDSLERQIRSMGLDPQQILKGALPFEEVLAHYEWADVLVLASETEGWPKAITEAMSFGVVCIGSDRGLVPQMLGDGRGWLVEPGNEGMLASAVSAMAHGETDYISMSQKASRWAQNYSLDGLRRAIRGLLIREWHLSDNDLRKIP